MVTPTGSSPLPGPGPLLLRGDRFEHWHRQSSVDYQNRFRDHVRKVPGHLAESALVVVTAACDAEIDRLSLELGRAGIPLYRIDCEDCATRRLVFDLQAGTMSLDGRVVRPELIWIRYFSPNSILVEGDPVLQRYVRDQWAAVMEIVREWPAIHVNPYEARRVSRVGQVRAAAALGLTVPPTCVASSAAEAAAVLGCPPEDLIAKVNGDHFVQHPPGRVTGVFPRRITDAASTDGEPVPLMFQRYVPQDHEIRVFTVGDDLIGYEVRKQDPKDIWDRPDYVHVKPVEVSGRIQDLVRAMLEHTGLLFSGFDFLITPDGDPVFLEYNCSGGWAWFEKAAGDERVSRAAFEFFARHPSLSPA